MKQNPLFWLCCKTPKDRPDQETQQQGRIEMLKSPHHGKLLVNVLDIPNGVLTGKNSFKVESGRVVGDQQVQGADRTFRYATAGGAG